MSRTWPASDPPRRQATPLGEILVADEPIDSSKSSPVAGRSQAMRSPSRLILGIVQLAVLPVVSMLSTSTGAGWAAVDTRRGTTVPPSDSSQATFVPESWSPIGIARVCLLYTSP